MRVFAASAVLVVGLATGCAHAEPKAPPSAPSVEKPSSFVLGEALIKSEAPPRPADLERGAGLGGFTVVSVEPQVMRFYLVRFARVGDGGTVPADAAFTQAAIEALRRVPGVLACEPNSIAKPLSR